MSSFFSDINLIHARDGRGFYFICSLNTGLGSVILTKIVMCARIKVDTQESASF